MLFLGYSFGLPAIAADVGSLKEEIIEGETGFVFKPRDSSDLGRVRLTLTSTANYSITSKARRAEIKRLRQRAIFVGQSRRDNNRRFIRDFWLLTSP